MSRKISMIMLSLLAVVALCGTASAGSTIFGGITAPMGDMGDAYDTGYHAGIDLHLPIVPMIFSAGPTAIYSMMDMTDTDESAGYLELLGTASFTFPMGPRVIGGAGWTIPVQEPDIPSVDLEGEFTFVVGTGWKFLLLDARAMWHQMGDSNFVTLSVGLGF